MSGIIFLAAEETTAARKKEIKKVKKVVDKSENT